MTIVGAGSPLTLGASAMLNCTSDLPILMAEWLYNGVVIARSSEGGAILDITSVNDSLHGRQYSCRVATPYGIQLENTTIVVSGILHNVLVQPYLCLGYYSV